MKHLKVFLVLNLIWLTACASEQSISDRYTENLKVVQTCMFNAIVGVLASPKLGLEGFNQVCEERHYEGGHL